MSDAGFDAFKADALAHGFDEVIERTWAPGTTLDTHMHAFSVSARVVRGEMWLTVGEKVRHLLPGETFTLAARVPHAERYGGDGATYWVARRNERVT
ncbi:MAG TPA: cupin domain-containing protein [Casimicrobiaceae bacterium]|jgi:quercetin dioxygenase-like cupin family protein|nr:cupin domain-containing protein [Casimicrobiaceae bacterium]